jgi:hypothetical protein
MRRNKKGSMELGINAIVIIIIALAILGLGIGFVTKLLYGSQEKFVGIIDRAELPMHADSQDPIKFETSNVKLKSKGNTLIMISVFNDGADTIEDVSLTADCIGIDESIISKITMSTGSQNIPGGTDIGFKAALVGNGADKGSYICTIIASDSTDSFSVSKQITVEVSN